MKIFSVTFVALAAIVAIGCTPRTQSPPATLEDQMRALRMGETDVIELEKADFGPDVTLELMANPKLRRIWIEHARIGGVDISTLETQEQLTQLKLGGLNDLHAENFPFFEFLTVLNLPHSTISDSGLAEFQKLPKVELLRIQSSKITDAGVAVLPDFPSLKWVHIIDAPITDDALDSFIACEKLESLYLDHTKVTDEGMSRFVKARRDVHVHFNDGHVASDKHAADHEH